MPRMILMVPLLLIQAAFAEGQLWLSPVNVGDCVARRITAKRTPFVDELQKKSCAENNPDKDKARACIENSRMDREIYFFTDRCSDGEYYVGLNGKEFKLRRVSKGQGRPNDFIGSFAGEGLSVQITQPRLTEKTYLPNEPRNEDNVLDAAYHVLITVKKGALKKTFKGVLLYGR